MAITKLGNTLLGCCQPIAPQATANGWLKHKGAFAGEVAESVAQNSGIVGAPKPIVAQQPQL